MPSKVKRTNLSRNSGAMVPASVTSSPTITSGGGKPKIKKKKKPPSTTTMDSSKKKSSKTKKQKNEETRPLEEDNELEDNMSDVSEDPVDRYNQTNDDGDYDEEMDDEPRFKYSTAELPEDSSRNTRCCLMTMCILCIIVAIAVSIVMVKIPQKKRDEQAAEAPSPTAPPPTANGVGMFTAKRESVNVDCSNSGSEQCDETCKDFDCCDFSLNEQASCFFGNREGCLNYARCHVSNPGTLNAPSPNINTICSTTAIANDPGPCEDVCLSVKCCWEDTSSCVDNNFYACADYAICQNLRGADLQVPQPIDGLEDFCDDYVVGSLTQNEACGIACEPASCCWEQTTANCLKNNFFTCLLHEPCGQLEFPEAFSYVPEPIDDVSLVCSKAYRDTNGSSKCEAACNRATCCSAAPEQSCFLQDPLGCIKYDGCKLLSVN
ncbi:hypothetical protein IV203_024459 [Nitzschia inconspicua]|uniref:Uncharacterized protein n=1 Tax=Nitzschia inconspicua TaxID=303405 RepID=A0A9K3PBN2_9STRA|nr:hypothetical protein IV203_024459 [Nitzschia inconspicua]